jgi:hypothetical protein
MSKTSYAHLLSSVQAAAAKEVDGGIDAKPVKGADEKPEPKDDELDGKKSKKAKSKKMESEKDEDEEGEDDEKREDKEEKDEQDDEDREDKKSKKAKKASASSYDLAPHMEAARLEERVRCARIFRSDAAAGRIETACQFAFHTDLSADAAIAIMETIPTAAAVAPRRASIDERMAKVASANVGSDVLPVAKVEAEGISEEAFAKLSSEQQALMIVNSMRSLEGEAPLTKLN